MVIGKCDKQEAEKQRDQKLPDIEHGQDGGFVPTGLPGEAGHNNVGELLVDPFDL